MAKDKRSFVAAIRNTTLRRIAMVFVVPVLLAPLIPALFASLYSAAVLGWQEAASHLRWEWSSRPIRALKLGLKQMWSKDWNPDR